MADLADIAGELTAGAADLTAAAGDATDAGAAAGAVLPGSLFSVEDCSASARFPAFREGVDIFTPPDLPPRGQHRYRQTAIRTDAHKCRHAPVVPGGCRLQ